MNKLRLVQMMVCEACIAGEGECCHEPGCIFIRQHPPEFGLDEQQFYESAVLFKCSKCGEKDAELSAMCVRPKCPKEQEYFTEVRYTQEEEA